MTKIEFLVDFIKVHGVEPIKSVPGSHICKGIYCSECEENLKNSCIKSFSEYCYVNDEDINELSEILPEYFI